MVAIRVANRVAIAIRNPELFWNGGYDQGCDRNPESRPETTRLGFFFKITTLGVFYGCDYGVSCDCNLLKIFPVPL